MSQNKATAKHLHREMVVADRTMMQKSTLKRMNKLLRSVDQHIVSLVDPDSYEAEQYRKLRYVIEEHHKQGEGLVIGICSPVARDGKSLTAINLAGALAQDASIRVLLVDVDLRRQSETMKGSLPFGNPDGVGLVDVVMGRTLTLRDVIQAIPPFDLNLDMIETGESSVSPYEILRSPKFKEFIVNARRLYDYVILDAPPVVPVSDCRVIGKHVDAFLMVVSANHTPRAMLEEALNLMNPEKMMGLVFNRSEQMSAKYYG
ncbi:MAG: CpsD/CapB family tyrosine-protein kinase, partial [Sciscionella sp.]